MPKHALLSPSSAHRWMLCPGSVAMTKDLPEETSAYAVEGTTAHRFAELAARQAFLPLAFSTEDAEELARMKAEEPAEMFEAVKTYLDCIKDRSPEWTSLFRLEAPLDISAITGEEGARGTADCVFVDAHNTLWIVDFKYGRGVEVSAERNPQLTLYALAFLKSMDAFTACYVKRVGLLIVQPRIWNVSEWTFSVASVPAMEQTFREGAGKALSEAKAWDGTASALTLTPEEGACRFCRAKATCPALRAKVEEALDQELGLIAPKPVDTLPAELPVPQEPEQVSRALGWLPLVKTWTDAVESRALSLMQSGANVPGYKLVAGRAGPRKWVDPDAAAETLVKAVGVKVAYERKLISPTAAEKLKKSGEISEGYWKRLEAVTGRTEPKPTVAPNSDKRPALLSEAQETEKLLEG